MNNLELNKRLAEVLWPDDRIREEDGFIVRYFQDPKWGHACHIFNVFTSATDREAAIKHYKVSVSPCEEGWHANTWGEGDNYYEMFNESTHKDYETAIINCFKKIIGE